MVRSRVYGILAGYEDQNDHDTLRSDPVFKLIADRSPDEGDLASQPTLSRFENAISIRSLQRLRDVFIDQFIASFDTPPRHLTFDLDAVDDPAHGCQQLTFWQNYYDQNQYLPLLITCADNDQLVMLSLRHGSAHAALGADDDVAYLVTRLRQVWPDVVLQFRGDCGFGVPAMYEVCEGLRVSYKASAERIKAKVKKTLQGVIEIGNDLLAVKKALEHGQFGRWLKGEFGWRQRTAYNFMSVADVCNRCCWGNCWTTWWTTP
jgi:hypothetical protein